MRFELKIWLFIVLFLPLFAQALPPRGVSDPPKTCSILLFPQRPKPKLEVIALALGQHLIRSVVLHPGESSISLFVVCGPESPQTMQDYVKASGELGDPNVNGGWIPRLILLDDATNAASEEYILRDHSTQPATTLKFVCVAKIPF